MELDKTTYDDLSVFAQEDEFSVFHKLDFTRTRGGRLWLHHFLQHPFSDLKRIQETQQILHAILRNEADWPMSISNGTIMVMERFYESALDTIPYPAGLANALTYKVFHGPDYSLLRYSVNHFADFIRGMNRLIELLLTEDCPPLLANYLSRARTLMGPDPILQLASIPAGRKLTPREIVSYGGYIRERFKPSAIDLIEIYGRIDAWYSMAMATKQYHLSFPVFENSPDPFVDAKMLYHLLLPVPVSYDVQLNRNTNFIFLTGANMAGKSTFIKAVGIAVFLAHLGMGVPAQQMTLSLFDGILSNINVVDNIVKGESYFFNEVQRIKNTILKINNQQKWLVLIDELFKGTNVQDAMKCSSVVIKGLIKIKNSLFILSTHLYEIGEELKQFENISFRYFETDVKDDQLQFSYQLKNGISNDRLGYLILKREKVVEMLDKL